jgi:hypothetical protein
MSGYECFVWSCLYYLEHPRRGRSNVLVRDMVDLTLLYDFDVMCYARPKMIIALDFGWYSVFIDAAKHCDTTL